MTEFGVDISKGKYGNGSVAGMLFFQCYKSTSCEWGKYK